jgi:hypothetical protein
MQAVLGAAPKPKNIWQRQFDHFDDALRKMAQMEWDCIPDEYMWYYFHDMAYMELQPDLFRHVFPACLKYWYSTLMNNESAERGDSDFHYALMRGKIVETVLSDLECTKLYDFFIDGFMDRVEAQNTFKYDLSLGKGAWRGHNFWIYRFNTLGIVAPVTKRIWQEWWLLDHPGKAFCAVMYASGLIYVEGENPIYGAWSTEQGGGGPYLTEIDGHIFDWAWRKDNLEYLKDTLTTKYLMEKLEHAALTLQNHEEVDIVSQVIDDARSREVIIEYRIADLLENLAKIQLEKTHWD